jgi:hypothetical protein
MRVGEEATRVLHDLANMESRAGIRAAVGCVDTRDEGACQAAVAGPAVVGALGVRERDAWGAGAAFDGFVDVRCGFGQGLIFACYAAEGDVLEEVRVVRRERESVCVTKGWRVEDGLRSRLCSRRC